MWSLELVYKQNFYFIKTAISIVPSILQKKNSVYRSGNHLNLEICAMMINCI